MSTASDNGFPGPQPDDVVVAARGIGKTYGHVRALHDVSFELRRGEVVAVFGDNGAGKSTLAKCLCGVETPDTGYVEINSQRVELHSIRDAERYGITSAHQDLALAPDLTVLENMYLGRELVHSGWRGRLGMLSRGAMAARSEAALTELQINIPSVRVQVGALSGGQKQAVAVARAAMWSRTGILMDEPTAALGTRQSDVVCELIRSTADRGLGVMVISHDIPRVLAVADRVIVLLHGSVALRAAGKDVTGRDIVDAMVGYHTQADESQ